MTALPFTVHADGSTSLTPDLTEAQRLLDQGFFLVDLHPYQKRPVGDNWNKHPVQAINPKATGYGMPLAANNLCSIDPDQVEMARAGVAAWGFDLEDLLGQGVRTSSTRPGSGGRSAFAADELEMLRWLPFAVFDDAGNSTTVLELRAKSENLQDCVPGVVYTDKRTGELCTQRYSNGRTFDEAPALPDAFARFWRLLSTDDDALREHTRQFVEAIAAAGHQINGKRPQFRPPMGSGEKLAFPSSYRAEYNRANDVESVLNRNGYNWHAREQRYSHPAATGAPGIRPIPGKDELWRSDHAGDPLHGTFDAWAAYVQLDHKGDLRAAEEAQRSAAMQELLQDFDTQADQPDNTEAPAQAAQGWQHPLTRVIELSDQPKPSVWLLPHFIAEGVVIIAGAHGVGKTTALLPLAMAAAGLHEPDYPLAPREWRHVVYVTEDSNQAERIIAGYAPSIGHTPSTVAERLHVVEAARMPADAVVMAAPWYRANYTRTVTTASGKALELSPLVVFDTKAAVFEEENENDNAEASKMIAAIKQRFAGLPTWIIGHVSKGDLSRDGAKSGMPTLRGASAFEGDANQTLFLVKERDDTRWLVRGKTRFEAKWEELLIKTYSTRTVALNVFEEQEELTLRWAIARPQGKTRQEMTAEAEEAAKRKQEAAKKLEMIDLINRACEEGEPLNRTGLAEEIGGRAETTKALIADVIEAGWAIEVTVPPELRTHQKRKRFLVGLTHGEREQYLKDGTIPPEKQEIPDTWKKQPKTSKTAQKEEPAEEDSTVPGGNA
tara:strand:+ start:355 stop:2691 length:2337 start_codon:yes stop_codon:yes gene_type:complete